jgi:hypothetical protein
LFVFAGERAEVAFHLDAVPEGVGLAEEGGEADGHGRCVGALAEHDLVDGLGGTPMARAMAFREMPMGLRYSSRRISPGATGDFMAVTYGVMAGRQW